MGFLSDLFGGKDPKQAKLSASEKELQAIAAQIGKQQLININSLQGLQQRLQGNLLGGNFVNEQLFGNPMQPGNFPLSPVDQQFMQQINTPVGPTIEEQLSKSTATKKEPKGLVGKLAQRLMKKKGLNLQG